MPTAPSLWNKFRRLSTVKKTSRRTNDLQRTLSLESLEQRRVLSVSPSQIVLFNSNLTIYGGADSDVVTVTELAGNRVGVRLESGGESLTMDFARSEVNALRFYGGAGNDRFSNDTTLPSRAWGEDGNDVLIGGSGVDEFEGGAGDDVLIGGAGDDKLVGGAGDDTISGDAGADIIYGNDGNDMIRGGADNDTIRGGDGNDVLIGEAGDDRIFGEAGRDSLSGGDGDDELRGGDDDDRIMGGSGNDVLHGERGDDRIFGEDGDDILTGGDGNDHLKGGDGKDTLRGGAGRDFLNGQSGDDKLYGDEDADTLDGEAGDDELYGGDGDDLLIGGSGKNLIYGQNGDDSLHGGDDADVLYGGEGNDLIKGGGGNDVLWGGEGNDFLNGKAGDDKIFGEGGNDSLVGEDGNDQLTGGDGADMLNGGDGDDTLWGNAGDDVILAGEGNDTAHGNEGADVIYGGGGNDTLRGNDGADVIYGDAGADLIYGDAGDDLLIGGDDDDQLLGGDGNDFLFGGSGDDSLYGDHGHDVLEGNDGNDLLIGGYGDDTLRGGRGNDKLRGREDNDELWGDEGDDDLQGESGNDFLFGGLGNDTLSGLDGDDLLVGDDGADTIEAGSGNDVVIGGTGADTLNGSTGEDLIIGGVVSHDAAKLKLLVSRWAGAGTYSARIQAIENEGFAAFLKLQETVFDDYVEDSVSGGSDLDWLFVPGSVDIYDPLGHHSGEVGHGGHHGAHVIDHLPVVEGFALLDSLDTLHGVEQGEKVSTLIPHADDPSKRTEHISLFELVRYDQVTHYAVSNGNWGDPSTWSNGVVPTNGARVLIPIGVEVTVDRKLDTNIETVRVDGTLSFATNVHSRLKADTVIVSDVGSFVMGTAANPIAPNVTAELRFTNTGSIDRTWDPYGISRGLITHGSVSMHGAAKTSASTLVGPVLAGTTLLTLSAVPTGWRVGDKIVIAGTSATAQEFEERTIRAIIGSVVIVDPLDYNHAPLSIGQSVHVANITRNALISSESVANNRRGHVMFMHNPDVHIANTQFHKLGRTDKREVINDPVVNANWKLVSGTGTNPRARYAVHFHRTGTHASEPPATVKGSVVTDNFGWGFVNHSSHVDFTNNVAFNVTGAGFVTEVGDEIGSFRGNVAINMKASGDHIESRLREQDHGHTGDGFWFQGSGITVVNNVAANAEGHAFTYYSRGLEFGGHKAMFLTENLADPSIANGADRIISDFVPVLEFSGNVGYSSGIGLTVWYNLRNAEHSAQSVFKDSLFWNNTEGAELQYSHRSVLRNLDITRDFSQLGMIGVNSNTVSRDITYDQLFVSGYHVGIEPAKRGYSIINGGTFATRIGVLVRPPAESGREVIVQGNFSMLPIPLEAMGSWVQTDVINSFNVSPLAGSIDHLFYDSKVYLDYGIYNNQQLYSTVQAASAVPFPSLTESVPPDYVELTAAQLSILKNQSIYGGMAPATAQLVPTLGGLLQILL